MARTSSSAVVRTCSRPSPRPALIDDIRVLVIPRALGQGKALFGSLHGPLRLRLTGTRRFDAGTVLMEYVPG
jgi:dihydrofolate reductase